MWNKFRIMHASLFFLIAAGISYFTYKADERVAKREAALLSYEEIVRRRVYDQPLTVVNGTRVADIEKHLRAANFGECDARAKAKLDAMTPRIMCRRAGVLAVKSFAPFDDYIFEFDQKSERVSIIKTGNEKVEEARLPSPVFSAVNLDERGHINERVRYELMLGKEVDPDSLPVKFFIKIEDQRFFEHRGNDWRGIARAIIKDLSIVLTNSDDEPLQGGSSITEQAAKLIFIPEGNKFLRRVWALFLAESLEQRFTKRQILELWLNLTVMGIERPTKNSAAQALAQRSETVLGFKTAARVLFNRSLSECTPAELAVLAVLPRDPQIFPALKRGEALEASVKVNYRKWEKRRRDALESFALSLEKAGKKGEASHFRAARDASVSFVFNEDDLKGDEALVTFIERDLKDQAASLSLQTPPHGEALAHGHVVITTIDRDFQRALSQRIEKELPDIKSKLVKLAGGEPDREMKQASKNKGFSFEVQVDVVVMSAEGGQLWSMSSLKTSGKRVIPNRANVNPPSFVASVAKPLLTAYALGEGVITLNTLIRASECAAPNGFRFDGPADDNLLPLSDHLVASRNAAFICVGRRIGIENALTKWRELFPRAKQPGPGFVSDPYHLMRGLNRPEAELRPTDVAEAYTALAHQGERQSARVIDSVYAAHKKLVFEVPAGLQVFKPEASVLVASVLRAGTRGLTQWKPTPGFDLALKTGSSSNTYWVVMFAPKMVLVVRYLIVPAEKLGDNEALKFSEEVSNRFESVFAGNVVKPFADSVLAVIKQKRLGWLRGTFAHKNVITVRIDPKRQCQTDDDSGVLAEYISGTEPPRCQDETEDEGQEFGP